MPKAINRSAKLLRRRRKVSRTSPTTSRNLLRTLSPTVNQVTGAVFIFMFAVSSVGLIVGGVG